MSRKYIQWGNWEELSKATGIKMPKPQEANQAKKKPQIEKFSRCKECGGQMTYIKGSNILLCECQVDVEKEFTKEDGTTEKKVVKQTCGNINLVGKDYLGYMEYLFKE